jgi:acyl-CoA synthetase (AMP-forming)/AMP-acid ligase II
MNHARLDDSSSTRPRTLVDLLQHRAQRSPDAIAYSFLDGDEYGDRMTYAQLDSRARSVAMELAESARPGDRVLLLFRSSPAFVESFFGCLYAGLTPVPSYPLEPARLGRTLARLRGMLADASPKIALTTRESLALVGNAGGDDALMRGVRWAALEELSVDRANEWRPPDIDGDALALIQYTSGSVSAPKGVMVSHTNVLENERMLQTAHGYDSTFTVVSWLPIAHDWGLIGTLLLPLYVGVHSVLIGTEAFLQEPVCWLRTISRYPRVMSGAPNFAYELCAAKIPAPERAGLSLAGWERAGVSAEPVRRGTIARFLEAFGPHGFRSEALYVAYGLAEATLSVSSTRKPHAPRALRLSKAAFESGRVVEAAPDAAVVELMSCGRVNDGLTAAIVDPTTCARCPPDSIGEIWLAGDSIARGYWSNPSETAAVFGARIAETGEGPFLRTGDLGFIHDGELVVVARLKDLIVIHGRNICPQDVELASAASHPALRRGCATAFSIDRDGEERIAIVQEVRAPGADTAWGPVVEAIRRAVFEQVDALVDTVVLVRPGDVPKTSSGKVRRRSAKTAYLEGRLDAVYPYIWVDARYEKVREDGRVQSMAVLLASGCAQLQINQDAFAGRNALQTGKPQDAVGYLRRAIDADPNYTLPNRLEESGLALLGRAYYEIGNLPEARATLEKAVSRDANDNMARLYLGLTLIKAGDPERGRREVETALKGINEWLEYVTSHGREGVFWDPARAIRSEIQRGLAPGLSVADVVVIAEGVGVKLDAEPEKALRDEINDRDANNNT